MEPYIIVLIVLCALTLVCSVIALILARKGRGGDLRETERRLTQAVADARREILEQERASLEASFRSFREQEEALYTRQDKRLSDLVDHVNTSLETMRLQLESNAKATDTRLTEMIRLQTEATDALRKTVDEKLTQIRQGNEKNLSEIRASVEEKLQTALDEKISRSFKEVSDRLAEVYKGLGEMQNLANDVGGLKKVLANVKARGILGEIQLGSILEEILSPEQYDADVPTIPGSQNRVEFAVRLPGGEDGRPVYLPIDSKFPMDAYLALQDAYDEGSPESVAAARKELEARVKSFAKDIRTKYVEAPHTTDFGIMFLPTEGLYAEVVRLGLVETLQSKYRINVAGPTTMAALLNSLQTGFRTLAIQKRSSEVWEILSAVRTEFEKFGETVARTQNRLRQANEELDELVGRRTRAIRRKLRDVSTLPSDRAASLLGEGDDAEE